MHAIVLVLVVIAALFALGIWAFCIALQRAFPPEETTEKGAVIPLEGRLSGRTQIPEEAHKKAA